MSRRLPLLPPMLAATMLAATMLVAGASPASAGFGGEPSSSPPPTSSGPQQASAETCQMYGSSGGFGMACTGSGGGGVSLSDLLGGRPLPACWDEVPPAGFRPTEPTEGRGAWWLRTCMSGVDRNSLQVTGKLRMTYAFRFLPPGDERRLSDGERAVIAYFAGDRQIPYPVVGASPSPSPRVGEDVSFSLLGERRTPALTVQGVTMYAEVVHLRVRPEGPDGPAVDCSGGGRAMSAAALDAAAADDPTVCRWSYDRSSDGAGAGRTGDRYPVHVTAFWEIRYNDGSGERTLGTFAKESVNQVRVAEVQTLVVS